MIQICMIGTAGIVSRKVFTGYAANYSATALWLDLERSQNVIAAIWLENGEIRRAMASPAFVKAV